MRLTAAGAEALDRLSDRVAQAQDALLAPLSARQRDELLRLLIRVVEHHDRRTLAGPPGA